MQMCTLCLNIGSFVMDHENIFDTPIPPRAVVGCSVASRLLQLVGLIQQGDDA